MYAINSILMLRVINISLTQLSCCSRVSNCVHHVISEEHQVVVGDGARGGNERKEGKLLPVQ